MTTYKDQNGTPYSTVDGKPPANSGIPVTVHLPGGQSVPGTYSGGTASPTKQN
jgi:hypothetical protein